VAGVSDEPDDQRADDDGQPTGRDEVRLRPVAEADLVVPQRLYQSDLSPFNWWGFRDVGELRRRLAEDGLLGPDGGMLIAWRGDERLGLLVWRKVRTGLHAFFWNIGIDLLPEARGRGYGTTAQRLLVEYLFAHTPVHRIEADTESDNVAEQRALTKAGFTREGVLRGAGFRGGSYRDLVLFSILRDEVPPPG
jgi:RimJ/RimL family protein N-acetyltransferase